MFEYFFLLLIIASFVLLGVTKNQQASIAALTLSSLVLVIFTSLRYFSGHDYDAYTALFEKVPNLAGLSLQVFSELPQEWGYIFLNSVFKSAYFSSYAFLAMVSIFSISTKVLIISRMSLYPYVAFLMYFAFNYFNSEFIQIRWALSLSLIYIGGYWLLRGNYFRGIVVLIISTTIHVMAFMPLLLVALCALLIRRVNTNVMIIIVLVSFILGYFIDVKSSIINVLEWWGSDNYFFIKLKGYLIRDSVAISLSVFLRYFLLFILATILYKKRRRKSHLGSNVKTVDFQLYFIYCVFLSFSMFFSSFSVFSNRLYIVCDFLVSLLVSNNIGFIKDSKLRMFVALCIAALSLIYWSISIWAFYNNGYIYDYRTWLNQLV